MRWFRIVLLFLSSVVVSFSLMSAQQKVEYSAGAETLFTDALAVYKKGDYKGAVAAFDRVLRSSATNQRTTAALIMKGKAQVYSRDYLKAEKSLKLFLAQYPASEYKGDAEYTLGLAYARAQRPEQALETFINCWRTIAARAKSTVLRDELIAAMDSTIDTYISVATLQRMVSEIPGGSEKEFLRLKLGQKQAHSGEYNAAGVTLNALRRDYAVSSFPERLTALQAKLNKPSDLKLGLLLPLLKKSELGGREREIGAALYEGISFAVEEHMKDSRSARITLELRDTERGPSVAVSALTELANDAAVVAVIGPAFSQEALAASSQANMKGMPIITPTANANGIAATGPFVFQANPDLDTRARAMANYAVKTLKLKRIAVLGSKEVSSRTLADAFTKEVVRLGADVVATEWYDKGATDLTHQLTNLRKKGNAAAQEPFLSFNERMTQKELGKLIRLGISVKSIDSLRMKRSIVNAIDLLGENAKATLDANGIFYTNGDPRIDSLQRVTTAIQGLYCPIASSAEIGVISSQVAFFGIGTKLLGSGEWNNLTELNANKRYCAGVSFESDTYTDLKEADFGDFASRFSQRYNRLPNKNNVYGYDVARLLLSLVQRGATTREQVKNALSETRSYKTLHSKISLFPRRVNSWLHILQFANETLQHVDEIEVE